jgi:hypothetical protein
MLQNVTVGKNSTATRIVHAALLPRRRRRRRRAPRPATTATSISRLIRRNCGNLRYQLGAADLGNNVLGSTAAAAPTRFPSAAAIPAYSTIQCPPSRHPTYPSAHPARAGVRSESPYPAERKNKKSAGSHGTGSLDGCPPLLRQQVSSRAPPSLSASSSARLLARLHGQSPTGTSLHSPSTSLTPSRSS